MRGAAGGALLCAELLIKKGLFSEKIVSKNAINRVST
jgi:hypothetical protein